MRDSGLEQAIEAAGGVGRLARGLGLAQPTVSLWRRVPAERVLQVEAVCGIGRSALRSDLYPDGVQGGVATDGIGAARAQEYLLLASLLTRAPGDELLRRLGRVQGDASALGLAHLQLADAARGAAPDAVRQEFFDLFIGVGRGELLPYASWYLTGFLHERPLARVREDLAGLGIERAAGHVEPEDHLGTLLEVMAGLIGGGFPAEAETQQRFFERHIAPWGVRFFGDLEHAQNARFYRAVARVGGLFLAIEAEALTLPDDPADEA